MFHKYVNLRDGSLGRLAAVYPVYQADMMVNYTFQIFSWGKEGQVHILSYSIHFIFWYAWFKAWGSYWTTIGWNIRCVASHKPRIINNFKESYISSHRVISITHFFLQQLILALASEIIVLSNLNNYSTRGFTVEFLGYVIVRLTVYYLLQRAFLVLLNISMLIFFLYKSLYCKLVSNLRIRYSI